MQQHPDHNDILPPALEKVSQELKRASSERSDVLAADLKARQRAMLIEHAERTIMPTAKQVEAPKATSPKSRAPLFAWGGFALAGALAVLALFVTTKNLPQGGNALRALRIPAAHAQDAFSVMAEKKDAQGVDTASAFKIESKVAVQQQDLSDALRIVPAIQFDLQKTNDNEYRIVPKEDLAEGAVYKVSIATIVEESTPTTREFSWAMQTKETFRLVSSIPATGSGNVPMNTGIEFKFTQSGFEAPTGSQFTISPAVKGHFEIRGRVLAFVPDESLKLGTLYEVKLDKSFAPTGVSEGLPADLKIRFETDINKPGEYVREVRLNVPGTVYSASAKPIAIDIGYGSGDVKSVGVTGYAVTNDVAREVMKQQLDIPGYAYYTSNGTEIFDKAVKNQAFKLDATVTNENEYRSAELVLPSVEKGMYLVRFEPKDVKNARVSWTLLQVTDTAAYSTVDRNGIYVWAVNAATNRPLTNLAIVKDNERVTTDNTGVARLSTPSAFSATGTDLGDTKPYVVLTIGEGKETSLLAIQQNYYSAMNFVRPGYVDSNHNRTMAFVRAERALYRTNDEMTVFGLARDRDAKAGLNEVTVRITKGGQLFDLRTGDLKVYGETKATPDGTGRFTANLKWSDLAPGYYSVEVTRDGGEVVAVQGFEIREYIKPSYSIEVLPEQPDYFMGDTVKASVRVKFFDGTPMAKASFNVDVENPGMTYHGQITTDENGYALAQIPTTYFDCAALSPAYVPYCGQSEVPNVYIRPTVGEEADQETSFSVALYRSHVAMDMDAEAVALSASGTVMTWTQDPKADDMGRSQRVSQTVTVTAYPKYWEKIQSGTYYDPITKLNVPNYTYEEKSDEPVKQEVKTDAQGLAHFTFALREDRHYAIYAETRDAQNHGIRSERTIFVGSKGDTGYPQAAYENATLQFSAPKRQHLLGGLMLDAGYDLNEEIKASYSIDGKDLDTSKSAGVFFVVASRGIVSAAAQTGASFNFRLEDRLMPNAHVVAVTFRNGRFESVSGDVNYAQANNELEFDIKPQKDSYAPGALVSVDVIAKNKETGTPVGDVVMSYAAVDKALLALGGGSYVNPLQMMYGWVPDEILVESKTHSEVFGGGGAEMGGGGAMLSKSDVRTNLKDVAMAGTVRTDNDGKATITFTAPDNLTTWQLDVAGVSDRLDGGLSSGDIKVTKPIFVDVVMPSVVLASDKPTMKLRAYGTGLTDGEDVSFEVDAPTLGISKQSFKGKAGQPMTLAIDRNDLGTHKLTIGVITAKGSDAIERTLTIDESHARHYDLQMVEAAPGKALPDADAPETTVTFVSHGRGSYLSQVYELAWEDRPRADALIAQRLANRWLKDYFGRTETMSDDAALQAAFTDYLDPSGAIRLKQYGSTDIELTSEIAATAPELLDRNAVAASLWTSLDDKMSSRSMQISAVAGLAALGEPVINELDRMAAVSDLTVQERLVLARGMEAAGNREVARALLNQILDTAVTNDTVMSLEVSKEKRENIEATADAAALAMRLADTRAEKLMNFVKTNWTNDAFPVLAKTRFVKAGLASAVSRDIRLKYTLGTDEKEMVFNDTQSAHELVFTRAEMKNFRVTSVDGPVDMSFARLVPGRAMNTPGLSIKRSYAVAEGTQATGAWKEGDRIKITLETSWDKNAQDGCYTVRDYLPANMRAIFTWGYEGPYYLAKGSATNADFVVCKGDQPQKIEYTARIISRGSYVAEAPIMQHFDNPSISTAGTNDLIEVK